METVRSSETSVVASETSVVATRLHVSATQNTVTVNVGNGLWVWNLACHHRRADQA
jgi:hypothetical protein